MAPSLLLPRAVNRILRAPRRRSGGFTLIELLVVLAVLAIAMGLGIPALHNFIIRSKTEGFAREIGGLLQRTRLEAIKANREGGVFFDSVTGELVAFIDADRDRTFNPDPSETYRTADYVLGRVAAPGAVAFMDPDHELGADSLDGFTSLDADRWAIFRPDGSVADEGAFRVADLRGNFLEIRVAPAATARIKLFKWQAPDGGGAERWLAAGDPSEPGYEPWEWK